MKSQRKIDPPQCTLISTSASRSPTSSISPRDFLCGHLDCVAYHEAYLHEANLKEFSPGILTSTGRIIILY